MGYREILQIKVGLLKKPHTRTHTHQKEWINDRHFPPKWNQFPDEKSPEQPDTSYRARVGSVNWFVTSIMWRIYSEIYEPEMWAVNVPVDVAVRTTTSEDGSILFVYFYPSGKWPQKNVPTIPRTMNSINPFLISFHDCLNQWINESIYI